VYEGRMVHSLNHRYATYEGVTAAVRSSAKMNAQFA
jgi:hypothetical protein